MKGFGGEMKVPSGELQNQLFVAEPGHGYGLIRQTRGHQMGIVGALVAERERS
jgi:hypothetical protein